MSKEDNSITYRVGNILDHCKDGTVFIPVNCKGTMGAGLAKETAQRFPKVLNGYKNYCHSKQLAIGRPLPITAEDGRIILLFPTKDDWRNPSQLDYIEEGFENFLKTGYHVMPLYIPKLGCGLGGLEWSDVHILIKKYFADYSHPVYVYV